MKTSKYKSEFKMNTSRKFKFNLFSDLGAVDRELKIRCTNMY